MAKKIKKRIFVIEPKFSEIKSLRNEILKKFEKVIFNYGPISENQIISKIKEYDGIILGLQPFNKNVIDSALNLKVVTKFGVGMDNVDVEYCNKKKIKIYKAIGCNSLSVAEAVVANSINLLRKINENHYLISKNIWSQIDGSEIYKKNFGIIGLGNIGKELVKRLVGFKCNILVNDIDIDRKFCKKYNLNITTKSNLFKKSDLISIHTPLTSKTENMINANTIKLMKNGCVLINTARGKIVDIDNNLNLFKKKDIKLFIDVFPNEPFNFSKKFNFNKNIFTPHITGTSIEAKIRIGQKNINDLVNYFHGK